MENNLVNEGKEKVHGYDDSSDILHKGLLVSVVGDNEDRRLPFCADGT